MTDYTDFVRDDYQRPVPGAVIQLFTEDGAGPIATDITRNDGQFTVTADDGVYLLQATYGTTSKRTSVIIGSPPQFVGAPGDPGRDADVLARRADFTALPGQTSFTLPFPYQAGIVSISVNGIGDLPTSDYTALGGTSPIVFNEPFNGGETIVIRGFLPGDYITQTALSIGLFTSASQAIIPQSVFVVDTIGYRFAGQGGARYIFDPTIGADFVAAHPTWTFRVGNRGFRLGEASPTIEQFGGCGDRERGPDTAAFRAAIDYMEAMGGAVTVTDPRNDWRVTEPIVYTGRVAIKFVGVEAVGGYLYGYEWQPTIIYTGPKGTSAFTCQTSGTSIAEDLNGVELENLMIARLTGDEEAKGDGGAGITFRGVTRFKLTNISVLGFDTDIILDDNPVNAGTNSVRCYRGVLDRVNCERAASFRMQIRGAAEIELRGCTISGPGLPNYLADIKFMPGTNGGSCDDFTAYSTKFIGSENRPQFNVVTEGPPFYLQFVNCVFERALTCSTRISDPTYNSIGDRLTATFIGCWWNGASGTCLEGLGAPVHVIGGRMHQDFTAPVTGPAVKLTGGSSTDGIKPLGSRISGVRIAFAAFTGIDVDYASNVHIDGVDFINNSSSTLPIIKLGAATRKCSIIGWTKSDNAIGPIIDGETHTIMSPEGLMIGGGPQIGYGKFTGTLDGNGAVLKQHNIPDFKGRAIVNAVFYDSGGAQRPLKHNYTDDLNISVSAADAANRPYVIFYTLATKQLVQG